MRHANLTAAVTALLLSAAPALADPTIIVTDVSVQGDDVTITGPISPAQTTAGPITLLTSAGSFVTWCIDIYHDIYLGGGQSLPYQIGPVTTDNAPSPTTLTNAQLTQIGQLAQYGSSLIGTAQATNDNLAAVQLAIWSVEYATFTYTGAADAPVAATLVAAAAEPATDESLIALNGTQSQVTAVAVAPVFGDAPPPVPEPATLPIIGAALMLLGWTRRRLA